MRAMVMHIAVLPACRLSATLPCVVLLRANIMTVPPIRLTVTSPPTEVVGNADYIEQLRKRFRNLGNGRLCDRLPTDDCTGQPKMHAPGPTNDSENLRNLFSGGLRLNMDLKS